MGAILVIPAQWTRWCGNTARVPARGRTLRFGRLDRNGPFRRICVADSPTRSLMTAPPRGAIESADRSLHNYFEQFTCLCADGICFDANPLYSGSNVGQRAIQRHWENDPSRTCRSIGSQPGGRWTWKSARNCWRAFALSTILWWRMDCDSKKRIRAFMLRSNWKRCLCWN